jgi:hypothetical protein
MPSQRETEFRILAQLTGVPDYASRNLRERVELLSKAQEDRSKSTLPEQIWALEAAVLAAAGYYGQARFEALEKENATLAADAAKARQEAAEAVQKLNSFTQEKAFAHFRERIATLEKENTALAAREQDIDRRATEKADEVMARVGFHMPIPQDFSGADGRAGSLTEQCLVRRQKL